MSKRDEYDPGAADGARIQKEGDKWALVVVRKLRHTPERELGEDQ